MKPATMRPEPRCSAPSCRRNGAQAGGRGAPAEAGRWLAPSPTRPDPGSARPTAFPHRTHPRVRRAARCRSAVWSSAVRIPISHRARRPGRRPVRVARIACVGNADLLCQVRARHPEAVIALQVDSHVGLRRHVARRALRAGASRKMMVMFPCEPGDDDWRTMSCYAHVGFDRL